MGIEESDTLDIVTKPEKGKMSLVIIDSGLIRDENNRLNKLIEKLKTYVAYVMSNEFREGYPTIKPKDVTIWVYCKKEPTSQMKQIDKVMPRGDRKNMIPVKYRVLNKA